MTTPDAICGRYNVSRESREKLETFVSLLRTWQAKINLVGPSTLDGVWTRHIADSLQLLPLLSPETRTIADLGSGAGFPGLILGVARPFRVHLFESNRKKAAFLAEAVRQTGTDGHVRMDRIENSEPLAASIRADAVTARALAPLPQLLALAQPFLSAGATGYFHKGQDLDAELTGLSKSWRIRYEKHPSATDSRASILVVKEAFLGG